MSETKYIKIYSGNSAVVQRIKLELEAIGISPIIKDEGESQRLAGYGSLNQGFQDIVIREDELDKANTLLKSIKQELDL